MGHPKHPLRKPCWGQIHPSKRDLGQGKPFARGGKGRKKKHKKENTTSHSSREKAVHVMANQLIK